MPVLRIMEDTDEVKDVKRMFDSIIKVLREYEDMMFDAWQGARGCLVQREGNRRGRTSYGERPGHIRG